MDFKSRLNCLWGRKGRFICFISYVESMKVLYNGKEIERSKIRVIGRKGEEGRLVKLLNFNFLILILVLLYILKVS